MNTCSLIQWFFGIIAIMGAAVFTAVMWNEPKRGNGVRNASDDLLASRERLARALAALPFRKAEQPPLALPAPRRTHAVHNG